MNNLVVKNIISRFKLNGGMVAATPFGSGHINDTYKIETSTGNEYLLQKINHFVFKDVPGLMNNIAVVTSHLKEKLKAIPGSNPDKEVLTLVANEDDGYFIKDDDGSYWRVFLFLKDTKCYDQVSTKHQAFEGGKAFGRFQAQLADLPIGLITDTIPNFHNIEFRLNNLEESIAADAAGRLKLVLPEIEFINQRRQQASIILNEGRAGLLPLRIIHYDTKFNNVLLDQQDSAQCVIDLDTVMAGYVAYDFGDAIRTIINTAPEDEPELSRINLNVPLFSAYTSGYLEQAVSLLTEAEINSLIEGVLLLPYMQLVRFLTDYINGDTYYKIHFEGQNLQRARAQLQLVKRLEEAKEELNNIILRTWDEKTK